MLEAAPSLKGRYPSHWKGVQHIRRLLREVLLSVRTGSGRCGRVWRSVLMLVCLQEELCPEYASYFEGKTKEELDDLAKSFALGESRRW